MQITNSKVTLVAGASSGLGAPMSVTLGNSFGEKIQKHIPKAKIVKHLILLLRTL
jgi:hypothetical protein